MSHMPGLIRPARDVSPPLGSPQTELESATVPGPVQCPGDPCCVSPDLQRGQFFSLHSNTSKFLGQCFALASLISRGFPRTLPPGWQRGFCMPQVLGTMRSRAPEEGENSLPVGSSRLERRLAGK